MSTLKLSKKDARTVEYLLQRPAPCLLCSTPDTPHAGIFQPTVPELWGGQRHKVRLIGYRLCTTCFALPHDARSQRIEARLAVGMVGSRN